MPFNVALSGINSASSDLEVISNNIANSNSIGFKKSRAEFADIYAITNSGLASDPIGQGAKLTAVAQQFTQGAISFTENNLDLAVSGRGFFRMDDAGAIVYSRAGAFGIDADGFLVNSNNHTLTGYLANDAGTMTGELGNLQVDAADLKPRATVSTELGANLDSGEVVPAAFDVTDPDTYNHSTSFTIYDSLGEAHTTNIYFRKEADNAWRAYTYVDGTEVSIAGGDSMTFNNDGSLNQVNGGAVTTATTTTFNPGGGAANMTFDIDLSEMTQYAADFGVAALDQDGYPTGRLNGLGIDETGVLFARYSNGQSKVLGQIVLANFTNLQGLRQLGDTAWAESFTSGPALVGTPGSTNLGLIQSGAVEESTVDVTRELVDMIKAQRNFQANAQVISTADTITQTIINIR